MSVRLASKARAEVRTRRGASRRASVAPGDLAVRWLTGCAIRRDNQVPTVPA